MTGTMNIDDANMVLRDALGDVPRNVTIADRHVEILTAAGLIVRAPLGELLHRPGGSRRVWPSRLGITCHPATSRGHGHSLLLQALSVMRGFRHEDA